MWVWPESSQQQTNKAEQKQQQQQARATTKKQKKTMRCNYPKYIELLLGGEKEHQLTLFGHDGSKTKRSSRWSPGRVSRDGVARRLPLPLLASKC